LFTYNKYSFQIEKKLFCLFNEYIDRLAVSVDIQDLSTGYKQPAPDDWSLATNSGIGKEKLQIVLKSNTISAV
jgi:hypothetical protein